MPYALRTRGNDAGPTAAVPVAKATPKSAGAAVPKKSAVQAPPAPGASANVSGSPPRARTHSPARKAGGASPRAKHAKGTVPLKKLKRGLHKELALVSRGVPSAVKAKAVTLKTAAPQRQSLNAKINMLGVLGEIEKLGANPIHRVARTNVKHGLAVKGSNKAGKRRPAKGKVIAAGASKNIARAVIKELQRVSKPGTAKPTEVNSRVQVQGQKALVNSQIVKTAVVKEINRGSFHLKKVGAPQSPKKVKA